MYHVRRLKQMARRPGSLALPRPSHDMNRENAGLMSRQQIINEVTNDRIWFVAELRDDSTNQGVAASMPFEIDRAMSIAGAAKFRPTVWPPRLFGPNLDELEFSIQLRVAHNLAAQRSAPRRDHLDHGLHF